MDRFGWSYEHLLGIRFAINAFIASAIVWFTLRSLGFNSAIWAIATMLAAEGLTPEKDKMPLDEGIKTALPDQKIR